jgi:hypothetical protein
MLKSFQDLLLSEGLNGNARMTMLNPMFLNDLLLFVGIVGSDRRYIDPAVGAQTFLWKKRMTTLCWEKMTRQRSDLPRPIQSIA